MGRSVWCGCCCLCLSFLVICAIGIFAWRILVSESDPTLYIEDLYVPALNKTTAFNTSVFVDLKFERKVSFITRPSYGNFSMTLLYGKCGSKVHVGTSMVQGFNMGRRRRVHMKVAVEAVAMPWEEAARALSRKNVVPMVVEVMAISFHVAVDASGHAVYKEWCGRWCWWHGYGLYCN